MTDRPREVILLELADVGDPHPYPARPLGQRLKAVLKNALRAHGLRCKRLADGAKAAITTKEVSPDA